MDSLLNGQRRRPVRIVTLELQSGHSTEVQGSWQAFNSDPGLVHQREHHPVQRQPEILVFIYDDDRIFCADVLPHPFMAFDEPQSGQDDSIKIDYTVVKKELLIDLDHGGFTPVPVLPFLLP